MRSLKPLHGIAVVLGLCLMLYFTYRHLEYFGNISFLGGILLLEVIVASLWRYDERFFALLIVSFAWAGMNVPLEDAWTGGRWLVLAAGAVVGCVVWTKDPRKPFGSLHLIAFFCICAAFVSATVSSYVQMASLKALSLLLLFLYCVSGARLAVIGREKRFFRGLLWGTEIALYVTALCYLGLGLHIWGNPNSMGAALSVGVFPILLWGWIASDGPGVKLRRLAAVALCCYLVFLSVARAGIVSMAIVTLVFCLCLHQYKLLIKMAALVAVLVAVTGVLAPETLSTQIGGMKDELLYKGHKEEGMLGSRRSPWEKSIASIKEHPLFGTGYGTSPTGDDPGLGFGRFSSSAETVREHGSSYMTITEWVGLLGVLPFAGLLAVTARNVWKVCAWMKRAADPSHYAIPVAMVVLAGLVHAGFEDWLFAVGYHVSVFFWVFAFLLADLVPAAVAVPAAGVVPRASRPLPASFGAVVPNR
ncbi:MAG: O-antigen ligase family protein [Terriglobales bacterium]